MLFISSHTFKTFTRHGLNLIFREGVELDNGVTVVVNCYDVVSPNPHCCKSDISERYFVEKLFRTSKLELVCLRRVEIVYNLPTLFQIQQFFSINSITIR
jgi:hypothetical protein